MKLIGDTRNRRTVALNEYVSVVEERLDRASRRGRRFIDTTDLQPPELAPSIHATLDGILTLSPATYHTYPHADPSSAFLVSALTNTGYVANARSLFSSAVAPFNAADAERLELFVTAFNLHMRGRYAIAPERSLHEDGLVLVHSANGAPPDTGFANRVFIADPSVKTDLLALRTLSSQYRMLLRD